VSSLLHSCLICQSLCYHYFLGFPVPSKHSPCSACPCISSLPPFYCKSQQKNYFLVLRIPVAAFILVPLVSLYKHYSLGLLFPSCVSISPASTIAAFLPCTTDPCDNIPPLYNWSLWQHSSLKLRTPLAALFLLLLSGVVLWLPPYRLIKISWRKQQPSALLPPKCPGKLWHWKSINPSSLSYIYQSMIVHTRIIYSILFQWMRGKKIREYLLTFSCYRWKREEHSAEAAKDSLLQKSRH
jgi:hypothetical protein